VLKTLTFLPDVIIDLSVGASIVFRGDGASAGFPQAASAARSISAVADMIHRMHVLVVSFRSFLIP
jgi:hypothetical protein